jgi:hypothetical protein
MIRGATVSAGRGYGAGDGNRTRVASLEGWGSTIELRPRAGRTRVALVIVPRCPLSSARQVDGVWRSLVAHSLWERGAVGSNPATPTRASLCEP